MSYQTEYIASVDALANRQAALQHSIQPLWPRHSPSQGPWRASAASMAKLPPFVTPPTTAPFQPQYAEITRMGQVNPGGRSPMAVLIGVTVALGVGFLVGKGKGKAQKRRGERYDFGASQGAAVLLLGPLGVGYQLGRYGSHKG